MDEHPALALREKKDSSILVAVDLVKRGEADAVVTAGHTGAGMAAAVLRLGRLPGVDRPALAVQMITATGPMVLLDIGANPDSTAGEPRPVRADGRDLRRTGPRRRRSARRAPVDRRGEGQGRRPDPARDRAARRVRSPVRGQRRGQGPDPAPGRRRRLRRGPRQRRHQVLRGPVDLHLRPVARRVRRFAAGTSGLPADAPERRPDPRHLRLREGRRLTAARGPRDGDHHPRPSASAGWSTYACEVAATTARTGVPALIAESLASSSRPAAATPPADTTAGSAAARPVAVFTSDATEKPS